MSDATVRADNERRRERLERLKLWTAAALTGMSPELKWEDAARNALDLGEVMERAWSERHNDGSRPLRDSGTK